MMDQSKPRIKLSDINPWLHRTATSGSGPVQSSLTISCRVRVGIQLQTQISEPSSMEPDPGKLNSSFNNRVKLNTKEEIGTSKKRICGVLLKHTIPTFKTT
ncbi:hypothetical protein XENORESO_008951 [Xenotaenia resolanae]|uniref:Uncharacterized protein n=1 Tax=Xenotaenia resolanae TaxID=208358 RepID=A0ABV0W2H4_9TELE